MPTLYLPDDWKVWQRDICEIMLDPFRRRPNEFREAMTLEALILVAKRRGGADPAMRDLLWPVVLAGSQTGPRMAGYINEDKKGLISGNLSKGALAGAVFLHVLAQKVSGSDRPTLERAFKAIYQTFAARTIGGGERRLRESWAGFANVSHLWAMTAFWPDGWTQSFQSHEGTMRWISTAAVLLQEGCGCRLRQSKRPTLLDTKSAWAVLPPEDDSYSLPDIDLTIPTPVEIVERIETYARTS